MMGVVGTGVMIGHIMRLPAGYLTVISGDVVIALAIEAGSLRVSTTPPNVVGSASVIDKDDQDIRCVLRRPPGAANRLNLAVWAGNAAR